jgi:hypothetical protein
LTQELLECFENIDRNALLKRILPSHKYISKDEEARRVFAVCKIAATFKMFRTRTLYKEFRLKTAMAIKIQRQFRQFVGRQHSIKRFAAIFKEKVDAWNEQQNHFKKSWSSLLNKRRVIIHWASLGLTSDQRRSMINLGAVQNSQLSRLCDASDPNVDIIYIAPFEINSDIQSYWLKLLELGGVANVGGGGGKDAVSRIKILVPENVDILPDHFNVAYLSLFSPRLLQKIKNIVGGRPAYIVPGLVGQEDLRLAIELNLPMLGTQPDVVAMYGTKSGGRRVFAAAGVASAPGCSEIYDESDLFSSLSKLMVDNIEANRWVFKIDNETGGRGCAYLDVKEDWKTIMALREEKINHPQRWKIPEIITQARQRVLITLQRSLSSRVTLAHPQLYNNSWTEFCKAMYKVGGVIEACPNLTISSPSVNLLLEPDGTVTITSSHDQLFSSPFLYGGATFPSAAPANMLHNAARNIGRHCFKQGIMGYIGVDFVLLFDPETDAHQLWAVDLNLRMSDTQSSFQLFHFLTKGTYVYQSSSLPSNPEMQSPRSLRSGLNATQKQFQRASYQLQPLLDEQMHKSGKKRMDFTAEERFYAVANHVYQPNLSTLQFGAFFNLCRLKGISFDLRARKGTVFMMMDSLAGGMIGMLAIGLEPAVAVQAVAVALTFCEEQANLLRVGQNVFDSESNHRGLIMTFRALMRTHARHEELIAQRKAEEEKISGNSTNNKRQ